jgi:hypothetical protein
VAPFKAPSLRQPTKAHEFRSFHRELVSLYQSLSGEAHLPRSYDNLKVSLKGDGLGHVTVQVDALADDCMDTRLSFNFRVDQTQLLDIVAVERLFLQPASETDMNPHSLQSDRELYEFLLKLSEELTLKGEIELAQEVGRANRIASGSPSEFLHEAQMALRSVIAKSGSIALSELQLAQIKSIIRQIEIAFLKIGGA